MEIAIDVLQGESVPRGYGVAWHNYDRLSFVAFPIPFNWVAWFLRETYLFLMRGPRDKVWRKAYNRGYEEATARYERKLEKAQTEWSVATGLAILAERERVAPKKESTLQVTQVSKK